jgi:hypothetical protein
MNKIVEEIIELEIPLPEKSPEENKKDSELFLKFFQLISDNRNRILEKPEYFYVRFDGAYIAGIMIGGRYIPLGVLILLWNDNKWKAECSNCQDEVFIYAAAGSPFSGRNQYTGVCIGCKKKVYGRLGSFGVLWGPAFEMCKLYKNTQKILRTKSRWFSWGKGIIGEETPDKIIESGIDAVDIATLIEELQ